MSCNISTSLYKSYNALIFNDFKYFEYHEVVAKWSNWPGISTRTLLTSYYLAVGLDCYASSEFE